MQAQSRSRFGPLRWLLVCSRSVYLWVRGAPIWLKTVLGFMLLGGVVALGYGYIRWDRSRVDSVASAAWVRFDEAARRGERDKMNAALAEILAVDPENELALSRRKALETGEAPSNDEPMIFLAMKQNLRENNLEAAVREADKWLKFHPRNWLAITIKAMDALVRGDRDSAIQFLNTLPNLEDSSADIEPGGLLLAFRLYRATDRDTEPLRAFSRSRATTAMKSLTVQSLPPSERSTILECYLEGFEPMFSGRQPAVLLESFGDALKLYLGASEEAIRNDQTAAMQRVAGLAPRMASAINAFAVARQITPEQASDFSQVIEDSARKLWERLLKTNDRLPDAYVNIAQSYIRSKDYPNARQAVVRGLTACGEHPELSMLFSRMLQIEGKSNEAYESLVNIAKKYPNQAVWWGLAAEASMIAGRRDLALQACTQMRKIEPQNRWAIRTEAKLWLDAGDPNKASQLLYELGAAELARDAASTQIYSRALGQAGLSVQLLPFLEECQKVALILKNAAPVVAALRGWADSKPGAFAVAMLVEQTEQALLRWPENHELYRIHAMALTQAAEVDTPPWESGRVTQAVIAADRFRAKAPNDRQVALLLGRLRLYGDKNPDLAYQEILPIRDAESDPELRAEELELLGTIYRLLNKLSDAERALGRASVIDPDRPRTWIQLALTYQALGKYTEARQAMSRAQAMPRDDAEQQEYVAAIQLLLREMP